MENLPIYIYLVFGLTAAIVLAIFYKASQGSRAFLYISLAWALILTFLSQYMPTKSLLPIFPLVTAPPTAFVISLFFLKSGKEFIRNLDIKTLMILHFARILVEVGLVVLATYKTIPESLTFEGRNFDILIGLTAPLIYYFGFVVNKLNKFVVVTWNLVGVALLLNVVFTTVTTILFLKPTQFALGYFPFFLLPSLIVPMVLFAHLASLKKLFAGTSR